MSKKRSWREVLEREAHHMAEMIKRAPPGAMESPEALATFLVGCGAHLGMSDFFASSVFQSKVRPRKRGWVRRLLQWRLGL